MIIHFIGPGGAGKTTIAQLLSQKFSIPLMDLDEYFMRAEGDIAEYIQRHGYQNYARRNIEIYLDLKNKASESEYPCMVIVCSSGFMTYVVKDLPLIYQKIKHEIERHHFTFLFLPSDDFEICVERLIERQLSRPYLKANREKEEGKIRQRLPYFLSLNCAKILTQDDVLCISRKVFAEISQKLNNLRP